MKKYESPTIEIVETKTNDIMSASAPQAVSYGELDGVDTEGSKSAIFDVNYWLSLLGKK